MKRLPLLSWMFQDMQDWTLISPIDQAQIITKVLNFKQINATTMFVLMWRKSPFHPLGAKNQNYNLINFQCFLHWWNDFSPLIHKQCVLGRYMSDPCDGVTRFKYFNGFIWWTHWTVCILYSCGILCSLFLLAILAAEVLAMTQL
jgi:hypothetical protein